jgi:cystathionine gamma-lyase
MQREKELGFSTRAIHVGSDPDPTTGAVITPIYATSTYKQESPGVHKGYDYGRSHNLTRSAYEKCLASLECGAAAFAFSSGLAAIATLLEALPAGSHLVSGDDIYGGTFRLFDKVRKSSANLAVTYAGLENAALVEQHITPQTRMLWVETPTNPMLKIADLEALAALAQKHNLIAVADNTFASPYLQNPLRLGFDVVVHSATKYLNGHSDVIGGVLVCREHGALSEKIAFLQNAIGSVPSPFDCFLAHRGVKTLAVRMQRQCENAQRIAEHLAAHPKIAKVIYPGLPSHPQYSVAKKQMRMPGGMISFVLKGGIPEARKFLESVEVFLLAESLGAVESLIEHPAIMTHATIPPEQRKLLGIEDGFIRISCGIEECDDLISDIDTALARI